MYRWVLKCYYLGPEDDYHRLGFVGMMTEQGVAQWSLEIYEFNRIIIISNFIVNHRVPGKRLNRN